MCGSWSSACGGLVGKLYNLVAVSFRCVIYLFFVRQNRKKHLYIPSSLPLSYLFCNETNMLWFCSCRLSVAGTDCYFRHCSICRQVENFLIKCRAIQSYGIRNYDKNTSHRQVLDLFTVLRQLDCDSKMFSINQAFCYYFGRLLT